MHLNTDPPCPPRKPCWRDMHRLTSTLLPEQLVMLTPLAELQRRIQEINATHPQYQEETPLVLAHETARRQRLSGALVVVHSHQQVA